MLRIAAKTCAVFLLAVLLSAPALTATPATAATSDAQRTYGVAASFDQSVLYWTNVARRRHGRAPLRLMSCLDNYATTWSSRMASVDVMSHQSLYPILRTCQRRSVGENVAWGTSGLTGQQVVAMWMRSPGHRANILNRRFRFIGIGAYGSDVTGRIYATQDFGR